MSDQAHSDEIGTPPVALGVDGRYGWTRWRVWTGPWRFFAGQWYRQAREDWGYQFDQRRAVQRVVYGPRVPLSGSSDGEP